MTVSPLIRLQVSLFLPDSNLATLPDFRSLKALIAQGRVGLPSTCSERDWRRKGRALCGAAGSRPGRAARTGPGSPTQPNVRCVRSRAVLWVGGPVWVSSCDVTSPCRVAKAPLQRSVLLADRGKGSVGSERWEPAPGARKLGRGASRAAPTATVKRKSCSRAARPASGRKRRSSRSRGPEASRLGGLGLGCAELREHPQLVRGRRGIWRVLPAAREGWSPPSALTKVVFMPRCYLGLPTKTFVPLPDVCLKHGPILRLPG